jgi:phenylpropionate dioxygenase-like ring-hydroxylating dioxygenase large terminal subunit
MSQHPAAQTETDIREEQTVLPTTVSTREQLDATTRVVAAAHNADLREALESVQWERRGPLRRLVRRPAPA